MGFEPDAHKGQVVVATLHKAKGLEWDRVYLISVNDYDFPAGMGGDSFVSEKWFIRDGLNLEAEALGQLHSLGGNFASDGYGEGVGTGQARHDYAHERLRLLFVGITRARKQPTLVSNTRQAGTPDPQSPWSRWRTGGSMNMLSRAPQLDTKRIPLVRRDHTRARPPTLCRKMG